MNTTDSVTAKDKQANYNRFLLLVAGLGGLLYGMDVGIIGGPLPDCRRLPGRNKMTRLNVFGL